MTGQDKDPRRQAQGRAAKRAGQAFENRLDEAFRVYREQGQAIIEKTPEPMRPSKNLGGGKFIAFYEKKAQADYKGVVRGGRTIVMEAKFTSTERMEQDRVRPEQADYLDGYANMGADCYVVAGFSSGAIYCVPWKIWREMKKQFGRRYVAERDLEEYMVLTGRNGELLLL